MSADTRFKIAILLSEPEVPKELWWNSAPVQSDTNKNLRCHRYIHEDEASAHSFWEFVKQQAPNHLVANAAMSAILSIHGQ